LFLLVAVMALSGCGAALYGTQLAIGAASIAATTLKSNGSSSNNSVKSNLALGAHLESYKIGEYEIRISDGFYNNDPYILFTAYSNGQRSRTIYFEKKNPDDMKIFNDFNRMDELSKKKQIKAWFMEYCKFDLGPIESETTEKSPALSNQSASTPR